MKNGKKMHQSQYTKILSGFGLLLTSWVWAAEPHEQLKSQIAAQHMNIPKKTKSNKWILGELEWVYLPSIEQHLKARVDTGAETSSISATDINRYRDPQGQYRVSFRIRHPDLTTSKLLDLPSAGRRVRAHHASGGAEQQSRSVVRLPIQIGTHQAETEFTLIDRQHMKYPVLLGRSYLDRVAVVDVSGQFIQPKFKAPQNIKNKK